MEKLWTRTSDMGDVPFGNRMVLVPLAACRRFRSGESAMRRRQGVRRATYEAALCPAGRADGEPVVGRFTPFEQHERGALRSDDVARSATNRRRPASSVVSSAAINSSPSWSTNSLLHRALSDGSRRFFDRFLLVRSLSHSPTVTLTSPTHIASVIGRARHGLRSPAVCRPGRMPPPRG